MGNRQDSIRGMASFRRLPEHEKAVLLRTKAAINRSVLTRNMHAYFEGCLIDDEGMLPAFEWSEFTDSIADALMNLGEGYGLGNALLQTLTYRLQERLNRVHPDPNNIGDHI